MLYRVGIPFGELVDLLAEVEWMIWCEWVVRKSREEKRNLDNIFLIKVQYARSSEDGCRMFLSLRTLYTGDDTSVYLLLIVTEHSQFFVFKFSSTNERTESLLLIYIKLWKIVHTKSFFRNFNSFFNIVDASWRVQVY